LRFSNARSLLAPSHVSSCKQKGDRPISGELDERRDDRQWITTAHTPIFGLGGTVRKWKQS